MVNLFESSAIIVSAIRSGAVVIPGSPPTFLKTLILEDLTSLLSTLILSGWSNSPALSPISNTSFILTKSKLA